MLITLKPGDIFDGHYKLLRQLSTAGASADVWLAIDLNTIDEPSDMPDALGSTHPDETTAIKVAIKIYKPQNALDIEGEQRFRDEFKIVYNCHHSNLIQPTHFAICGEMPYLVMPYCSRGSSEKLVGKLTDEKQLWKYVGDVASGLSYLHAMQPPIVHQDIKPANVLIDESGNYAITDFGISVTRERYQHHDYSGTYAYMAPERFSDELPQAASDVYAFGVTIYELLTGQVPFGEKGGKAQPEGDVNLNFFGLNVPASVSRLIAACLSHNPESRPTAAQIAEAARQQTFPAKHRTSAKWIALAIVAICTVACIIPFINNRPKRATAVSAADVTRYFDQALRMADSSDPVRVHKGMAMMDSIARAYNYIPAYYEISRTYGLVLNIDSAQYNPRRRVLGIEMGNEAAKVILSKLGAGFDMDFRYMIPKKTEDITKANNACLRILEIGAKTRSTDSVSLHQMTNSAWTLGVFNLLCNNSKSEAKKYFEKCQSIALQAGDTSTFSAAKIWLENIYK